MRTARLIATAVATLLLSATAVPAHADDAPVDPPAPVCTFSNAKVSPSGVVLGIKKIKHVKVTATAANCENEGPAAVEFDGNMDVAGPFEPSATDPTKWSGTVRLVPKWLYNSDAGKGKGMVVFEDGSTPVSLGANFTLKRASRLDVGGLPSKIKKNKKFYYGAFLDVANWEGPWYGAQEGKKVRLQTHTKGHKYKTIKTVTSFYGQNGGFLPATARLKKTTWFRWVFDGTATTSAVTAYAGHVTVKK
ncbi:hypothetical protein [uncultured Friedmanniella sp.]|uniref:hypothetical protein n=1 Tax=uncultured Friedmanniella sp. TaxID=335381 RepID=UPI0035CC18D5